MISEVATLVVTLGILTHHEKSFLSSQKSSISGLPSAVVELIAYFNLDCTQLSDLSRVLASKLTHQSEATHLF